jgi:hypothetical protein
MNTTWIKLSTKNFFAFVGIFEFQIQIADLYETIEFETP